MKNKTIFRFGFLCVIAFLIFASYLWYLYFHNYEGKVLSQEKVPDIEILNSGKIDYVNAKITDTFDVIPVYYFRVKNNTSKKVTYKVLIKDVRASEAKDGCTEGTMFKRNELKYELSLKGKVVASGVLSKLKDNVLYQSSTDGGSISDYSMRVWLNDDEDIDTDNNKKHYHYIIDVEVI